MTAWSAPHQAQWEYYMAPAISAAGVFVDGGSYGGLYGFNPTSGTQLFFQSLDQYDLWTPTLHGTGMYSFVMGKFRAHDKATGAILWTLDLTWNWAGYSMNRTVATADNRAYLVNDSLGLAYGEQELVCIDLATHAVAWKVVGKFTRTPAVNNGLIYVLSENTVQARSSTDGRLLATFTAPAGEILLGQPLLTDALVVAGSSAKTFVFGRYDQALVQTFALGGTVAASDDQLIVASTAGTVSAFAAPPAVTFSPAGGSFAQPVDVIVSAADSAATVRYTMDGSAPTLTSPVVVSGQTVRVAASVKIRTITVKGSAISRIYQAAFTVNTPVQNWRQTYFGTTANAGTAADTFDFDGDGLINLLEFGFGTDPKVRGTGALLYTGTFAGGGSMTAKGQPITRMESTANGIDFRALFIRRKDFAAAGLTYAPQFSGDLVTWLPGTAAPTVLADDGTHQVVSIPYPPFVGGKKARFFKISVTIAP